MLKEITPFKIILTCLLLTSFSTSHALGSLNTQKTRTALSIDGGGIRGLMSGIFLAEVEKQLGCPLRFFFDEMIGTSTGGIIALGLSMGYTAEELIDLYVKNGNKIFQSSLFRQGVTRAKYDQNGIETLLEEKFGDQWLSQISTNVTVTSYNLNTGKPYYFSSAMARQDPKHDFLVATAARSTSAAPTYFEPAEGYSAADQNFKDPQYFIDGGVIMNNPAVMGFTKIYHSYPQADDYIVLSVGTGDTKQNQRGHSHAGGILSWGPTLINIMLGGVSDANHDILELILPTSDGQKSYYRVQAHIPLELEPMDNVSVENINALRAAGYKMVQDHAEDIKKLVVQLKSSSSFHQPSGDFDQAFCLAR